MINQNEKIQELKKENEDLQNLLNEIFDKESEVAIDLQERIEENIIAIETLSKEPIKNEAQKPLAEETDNSQDLFEAILNCAIIQAFKFIIIANGNLEIYEKTDLELIEDGFSINDLECRESLAWLEEDDDNIYEAGEITVAGRKIYNGPYTFNFIGEILGTDIESIRKSFKTLKTMSPDDAKSAWERYRNQNLKTENSESNNWDEPTEKEIENLADQIESEI